jgi:DNA-binding NarL/FixJ family response regulator
MEANISGFLSVDDLMDKYSISVALAETDEKYISAIKSILEKNQTINLVNISKNGYCILDYCLHNDLPDVLLISYELDLIDGIQTTTILKKIFPEIKIIILSNYVTLQSLMLSIKVGALGFKPKSIFKDDEKNLIKKGIEARLTNSIYKVNNGDYYISNLIFKDLLITPEFIQARALADINSKEFNKIITQLNITDKEVVITLMYCTNLTKPQIADLLGISVKTLDNHLTKIARKINSNSTKDLVLQLYRLGIIKTASYNKINELIINHD